MSTARAPTRRLRRLALAPWAWLARARGWQRVALVLLCGSILLAVSWIYTYSTSLSGYPDVGDPFDVAAFLEETVPAERDAFVVYREAADRVVPLERVTAGAKPKPWRYDLGYADAPAEAHAWLEANRPALEAWRRAAERPAARRVVEPAVPWFQQRAHPFPWDDLRFPWLSLLTLEAHRLHEAGEPAGAWGVYRGWLRTAAHQAARGGMDRRQTAHVLAELACKDALAWAADPGLDAGAIRRALADVAAADALWPSVDDSIRCDYVMIMGQLNRWEPVVKHAIVPGGGVVGAVANNLGLVRQARIQATQDPERSRRVVRLVVANWLNRAGDTPRRSADAVVFAIPLFDVRPEAPPSAHALPVNTLAERVGRTTLGRTLLGYSAAYTFDDLLHSTGRRASNARNRLLTDLARRLYTLERGAPPAGDVELIGTYLTRRADGRLDPIAEAKR